ncbi:FtsK/SpoIIIE domain-containing protein [Metabacillus sp. Hm71]|uniref:FtsK/SpoIIIE domain-containing protein n=1 Tax=Metabacillus sp. Hm71 TaxID=3450743 RepID=UPI003F41C474
MIEFFAVPAAILGGSLLIKKRKLTDKQKIEKVFENARIGIPKNNYVQYPRFKSMRECENHTVYNYSLPYGLSSDLIINKFEPVFKDALDKHVVIEFNNKLSIKVYEEKLPIKWDYDINLIKPNTWEIPFGKSHDEIIYHDFDKYPHLIDGGTTRFGKTVFLKSLLHSLIYSQPDNVEIYILDLKGGLEFSKYDVYPQVKSVSSDILESYETLYFLVNELKSREKLFKEKGWNNVVDTPHKKRTFIIVDEGAELCPNFQADKRIKKVLLECQAALSEIARIGGGLGFRLIFSTQYPIKEVVPMQIKMNTVARVSFLVPQLVGSMVILDEEGAEKLPHIPGRAIYKTEKKIEMQVPYFKETGGIIIDQDSGKDRIDTANN